MHELSIAENLMGVIREVSTREKFIRVNSISLRIGEMAGVDKDALSFSFEIVAKGTVAEGAVLDIEIVPLTARCNACGTAFKIEDYVFRCGSCDSTDISLVSGREIKIDHIDVKEDRS